MTNTTENKTTAEVPYLFLEELHSFNPNREIIVAKKEWFEDVASCEIRNNYGIIEDECFTKDENDGECCCETVRAYEYWDGSNHQHVVIDAPWDVNYSIVDDEQEISALTDVVKKAQSSDEFPWHEGGTGYRSCTVGEWVVTESQWQGYWSLYTITENEDE